MVPLRLVLGSAPLDFLTSSNITLIVLYIEDKKMKGEIQTNTLPEMLVKKTRLPWSAVTGISAFLLLMILVLTALAEDKPITQLGWDFWRVGLQGPAILIYILSIYPVLNRVGNKAFESILPLLDLDKDEIKQLISRYYSPRRSRELLSLLLGAGFIVLLSQPWIQTAGDFHFFEGYVYGIEILMFSLLALIIYHALQDTRFLTKINQNLKLDIFDIESLAPIARWSLGISLAFIGGIIISIVFQDTDNLMQWQTIMIYAILVGTTVVVFFMSMWSTHTTIVKAKISELTIVRQKLTAACRKLRQNTSGCEEQADANLHYEVAAWGLYERQIREVKEWPLNAGTIGRLVLSAVSPGLAYLLKLLSGGFPGS